MLRAMLLHTWHIINIKYFQKMEKHKYGVQIFSCPAANITPIHSQF